MAAARWMLLIWLGSVVISTVLVGWVVLWHRRAVQRSKSRLQDAFDALLFDTPVGRVTGEGLTVVKIAYQIDEDAAPFDARSAPAPWDSLWYATGPGPSYFLAICTVDATDPQRTPRWTVRPLDESRMRVAVRGDRWAGMLAFGEAIKA